ncbi:MAG: aldo/keto reductase [Chitinophagaceae bacterium]
MLTRIIPSTNEELPVYGLGTWKTFDVDIQSPPDPLARVLQTMQKEGATLIDSSPMYGTAEEVVGELTGDKPWSNDFFYATKVWTTGKDEGIQQMESSFRKMKRTTMDLVQVHNLTDWKTQLQTLREWKEEGRVRYIGITHYTDSMHEELANILSTETLDFVQFNYSIFARNAEKKLLGIAADRGVATLINKPFGTGNDFNKVKNLQLPFWSKEYGIKTWSQFFIKYIISHPAVTCIIPATTNPAHAEENMKAVTDNLPDHAARKKMVNYITNL